MIWFMVLGPPLDGQRPYFRAFWFCDPSIRDYISLQTSFFSGGYYSCPGTGSGLQNTSGSSSDIEWDKNG